jgi:hypothetical protein
MALTKIVSGGQAGVDRGTLDAALVAGFACGGWCPANRAAEDGEIPERYPLTPLPAANASVVSEVPSTRQVAEQYRARKLKNVQDSDGTVILFSGTLSGGTFLTQKLCARERKPVIALDAQAMTKLRAVRFQFSGTIFNRATRSSRSAVLSPPLAGCETRIRLSRIPARNAV